MIRSVRVTKGWPTEKLDAFKQKKAFAFKPGANVLFGRNGSGKTTLLKIMGAFSGCHEHGGWSNLPESFCLKDGKKFPACLIGGARLGEGVEAKVAWDGTATFMHLAAKSDEPLAHFGMPHDVFDDGEQISVMMSKLSSGQGRALRLGKVLRKAKLERPDILKLKPYDHDSKGKHFLDYVKKLPRKGPHTLLLDEPEKSLDVDAQILFWTKILPAMAQELQVIVTSHSPFALFVPSVNVVELELGDVAKTRELVGCLLDDWRRS